MGEKRIDIEARRQRATGLAYAAGKLNGEAEANRRWREAAEKILPPTMLERLVIEMLGPEQWQKRQI